MSAQASQAMPVTAGLGLFKRHLEQLKPVRYLVIAGLLLWVGLAMSNYVQNPAVLPIKKVRIKGEMKHVTEAMLQQAITGQLQGGFFNTDVETIQHSVESLPWVARASVRRVWPETLFIHVIEQQAVAAWRDGGLLNIRGELFKPEVAPGLNTLPVWQGPEGSQQFLFEKHADFQAMLKEVDMSIVGIQMDKRHAIRIQLDNGIELVLGRSEQIARLQRFIDVFPKVLAGKKEQIKHVDLRYSNGLSVGWKKVDGVQ